MDNYEKYRKQIIDIVIRYIPYCDARKKLAGNVDCMSTNCNDCKKDFAKWFDEEYKDPEINWSKVPIDTPVFVSNFNENCDGENVIPRHFYGISKPSSYPYVTYGRGATSFSGKEEGTEFWRYCRLARKEDVEKYKF